MTKVSNAIQSPEEAIRLALDSNVALTISTDMLVAVEGLLGARREDALRSRNPSVIAEAFAEVAGAADAMASAGNDGSIRAVRAQDRLRSLSAACQPEMAELMSYRYTATDEQREIVREAMQLVAKSGLRPSHNAG